MVQVKMCNKFEANVVIVACRASYPFTFVKLIDLIESKTALSPNASLSLPSIVVVVVDFLFDRLLHFFFRNFFFTWVKVNNSSRLELTLCHFNGTETLFFNYRRRRRQWKGRTRKKRKEIVSTENGLLFSLFLFCRILSIESFLNRRMELFTRLKWWRFDCQTFKASK